MNYESRIKGLLRLITPLFIVFIPLFWPEIASAHAFGALYNLPVPFWLYLYGGAAALIVSFLVIGYFINPKNVHRSYPTVNLFHLTVKKLKLLIIAGQIISVCLFLLAIVSGILGQDSTFSNFNMTFFWIVFLLGMTYSSAIFGNIYSVLNPWKAITGWYEKLTGLEMEGFVKYPKKLGYFPALFFYFMLIWLELVHQTSPYSLSLILIQYTIINVLGVYVVGRQAWFKYCEFFSVFFRLISHISPVEVREGKIYLRPPFAGLIQIKVEHFSLLLFILFMLSSTAFDGFRETTPWFRFYWGFLDGTFRPILGDNSYAVIQTLALAASPLFFLLIYLILVTLAKFIAGSKQSIMQMSLGFAASLIPIAFVYNVAHYYTLIITEAPNIIRLVSDPLGAGWNLFHTADFYPSLIPGANFVWHSQVAVIIIGHIAGVYLAHLVAIDSFPSHKKALLSQLPMLLLMVSYTMIGLWILSQPITSGV